MPTDRAKAATAAPKRPLILHVTECWGGGVQSAIIDFVAAAADYDHWVILQPRAGEDVVVAPGALRVYRRWSAGTRHREKLADLRAAMRELAPMAVHVHSTHAGARVRLSAAVPRSVIVYTPHCYGFFKKDLSFAARLGVLAVEAALAWRTGTVAAVSPHEARTAFRLRPGQPCVYVPNAPRGGESAARRHPVTMQPRRAAGPLRMVTVGRIAEQKDPRYFAAAALAARRQGLRGTWTWIGDGDPGLRTHLQEAGVEVTGWLPRDEVRRRLDEFDVYAHTARWEGAPLAVLEAAGAGLPVVARAIPALRSLGLDGLVRTPEAMAEAVGRLADPGARRHNVLATGEALATNRSEIQAQRLIEAYTPRRQGFWALRPRRNPSFCSPAAPPATEDAVVSRRFK